MSTSEYIKNRKKIKANLVENPVCPYCNSIMDKELNNHYSSVTIDHKIAKSKGGSDSLDNLIACCGNCNTRKGNNKKVVLFYLKAPKKITTDEYRYLNDFVEVSNRITALHSIKQMICQEKFSAAINLIKINQKNTTSKGFFNRLLQSIKQAYEQISSKIEQVSAAIAQILARLDNEIKKLIQLKEKVNNIEFGTYSLMM